MVLLNTHYSITKNSYSMGVKSFKYILEMPNDNLVFQEQEVLQELSILYKYLMQTQINLSKAGVFVKSSFFCKTLFATTLFWFLWNHLYSICNDGHTNQSYQLNETVNINVTL